MVDPWDPKHSEAVRKLYGGCGAVSPDGTHLCILPNGHAGNHGWGVVKPYPRRFILHRMEDVTGVSGVGEVAWGVLWPDGSVAIRWNTEWTSTAAYASLEHVEHIHLHHGATQIVWLDE